MKDTAIIWDLDGTLLDTLEDLKDAVNYALTRFHCPERTLEEIRRFVGNGAALLIRRAMPGDSTLDPQEVLACYRDYYDAHCRIKTGPYPGIMEVLEKLQCLGYPMAVVSNKPDTAVKTLCSQFFPGLYARGESGECPRKPAPDMVFRAMEALGVTRCIYVGDSEVDVATAKNANVPCLSVLWGFRDRDVLTQAGAAHFCENTKQLPEILGAMEESYGK